MWKRDALLGALAGVVALVLGVVSAPAFPDSSPLGRVLIAAMAPGIALGLPLIVGAMWLTEVFGPPWTALVTAVVFNVTVYSATWVAFRRSGPASKASRWATVALWVVYLAFAGTGGLDRLDPFGD